MRGAARALSISVAIAAGVLVCAPSVQTQGPTPIVRLPVGEQLPGLPGRFWVRLIGDAGRLPQHERLVVLASDGRVLDVVEGGDDSVVVPEKVDGMLASSDARLVLAHNHPASTSLSGADLAQLDRKNVERVVALGHDGSVYEAMLGAHFSGPSVGAVLYPQVEARVLARLTMEAARVGASPRTGYDQFSHLVALVLGRAGVIDYRFRMSVSATTQYMADADWIERLVASEATALTQNLRARQ